MTTRKLKQRTLIASTAGIACFVVPTMGAIAAPAQNSISYDSPDLRTETPQVCRIGGSPEEVAIAQADAQKAQDAAEQAQISAKFAQEAVVEPQLAQDIAAKTADDASAHEQSALQSARDAYDALLDASADATAAQQAVVDAQVEQNTADAQVTAAQKALGNAKVALDEATTARELVEVTINSDTAVQEAQEKVSAAQAALDQVKKTAQPYEQAVSDAQKDADDAQQQLADATVAEQAAQEKLNTAQNELTQAQQEAQAVATEIDTIETQIATQEATVAQLETALADAKADQAAAAKAVEEAQAKKDAADAAAAESQAKIAKGSQAFFETMGSQAALDVLTTDRYGDYDQYTTIGVENDATSLENMEKAINAMFQANELRTAGDNNFAPMDPLLVTDQLMALSQINANISAAIKDHPVDWSGGIAAGEIWAPGDNPYDGWYYAEKILFDKYGSVDDPTLYIEYYKGWIAQQTGHYESIMDSSFKYAGFGSATGSRTMDFASYTSDTAYTVEEYKVRFNKYYNDLKAAPERAQQAAASLSAAQESAAQVNAVVASAQTSLDKAKAQLQTLETSMKQKESVKTAADQKVIDARQAVSDKQSLLDVSHRNTTAAQVAVASAQTNLNNASDAWKQTQETIAGAEKDVQTAEAQLASVKAVMADTMKALEEANAAEQAAQTAYEEALAAEKDAIVHAKDLAAQLEGLRVQAEAAKEVIATAVTVAAPTGDASKLVAASAQADIDSYNALLVDYGAAVTARNEADADLAAANKVLADAQAEADAATIAAHQAAEKAAKSLADYQALYTDCTNITPVFALPIALHQPNASDPASCTMKPYVVIPEDPFFTYTMNGETVAAGEYQYAYGATMKIVAVPKSGVLMPAGTQTEWIEDLALPQVCQEQSESSLKNNTGLVTSEKTTKTLSDTGSNVAGIACTGLALLGFGGMMVATTKRRGKHHLS